MIAIPKMRRKVAIGEPLWEGAKEADLADSIRLHLAHIPWCRFWQNKERFIARGDGSAAFVPGLAEGSADLIGVVSRCDRPVVRNHAGEILGHVAGDYPVVGVFTAIELKQPRSYKKPKASQDEWMDIVQRMGGVTGWTRSLFGAFAIIGQARGCSIHDIAMEISDASGKYVVES